MRAALSRILAVAWREAALMRHDKGLISVVAIQPVMMLLLYGYGLSQKPANVPWTVLDRSQTTVSRRLVADVEASGYFLPHTHVASYAEGRALLGRGKALALLVVPEDFRRDAARGRPRVQLLLDGSDPLASARIGSYVGQILATFDVGRGVEARHGALPMARAPGVVDVRQRFAFNPTLSDRIFLLGGLAAMLLTNLCFSMTSHTIVGERESGTYEQTLALPITGVEIVLGKLAPLVVVAYGVLGLTLLLQGFVFGLWPAGSLPALVVVTLPFVLASMAIGVLVSSLARTSAQAVFITVFFIMPSFVLGGLIFPYQLMPPVSRWAGAMFPMRWYQIASRRIFVRGGGLEDVLVPMGALVLIFLVVLAVIRLRLKPRLG